MTQTVKGGEKPKEKVVVINCPHHRSEDSRDNKDKDKLPEKTITRSTVAGGIGRSDDLIPKMTTWTSILIGVVFCFMLWPMIATISIVATFGSYTWILHILVWGVALMLFFGLGGVIPPGYVALPTLFGKRTDVFLFAEGWQWFGIFGKILMPKKIFTSTTEIHFVSKDKVRMVAKWTFSWMIYNSFGHSQLDHGESENENEMRHVDESRAEQIVDEAFRKLGLKHDSHELINFDTATIAPEVIRILRQMPGERDNDLRIRLYGIEFAASAFSLKEIRPEDPKVAEAYESETVEARQRIGQGIQMSNILENHAKLSRRKGVSAETALNIAAINAGLPGVTAHHDSSSETINVGGEVKSAEDLLAKVAAISRGKQKR